MLKGLKFFVKRGKPQSQAPVVRHLHTFSHQDLVSHYTCKANDIPKQLQLYRTLLAMLASMWDSYGEVNISMRPSLLFLIESYSWYNIFHACKQPGSTWPRFCHQRVLGILWPPTFCFSIFGIEGWHNVSSQKKNEQKCYMSVSGVYCDSFQNYNWSYPTAIYLFSFSFSKISLYFSLYVHMYRTWTKL